MMERDQKLEISRQIAADTEAAVMDIIKIHMKEYDKALIVSALGTMMSYVIARVANELEDPPEQLALLAAAIGAFEKVFPNTVTQALMEVKLGKRG